MGGMWHLSDKITKVVLQISKQSWEKITTEIFAQLLQRFPPWYEKKNSHKNTTTGIALNYIIRMWMISSPVAHSTSMITRQHRFK